MLVTKILANRLKKVLPQSFSFFQSTFVPSRQIFDNVIVAFELLCSLHENNNGKKGFMALKLDMSKTCDRVEWEFFRLVVRRMGFVGRWVELVMSCIATSSSAFIINGTLLGLVILSRSLRQGYPLSSYFFLLCA